MELEELKRFLEVNSPAILRKLVDPIGTEYDVVRAELKAMSILRISNRQIEIPGLTRSIDLIVACVAEFKDVRKWNVMPLQFAKADDIVVMPLRLEHIAGNIQVWRTLTLATGRFTGEFGIIPQTAIGAPPAVFKVPENQRFVLTDIIELNSPPGLTAVRIRDIDGVPQIALDATLAMEASDLQMFEFPHPIVADASFAIDGKLESPTAAASVTTAPWVIGVWIGLGKDVPGLIRI